MRFKRKIRIIGTSNEITEPATVLHIPFGQFKHSRGMQCLYSQEAKQIVTAFNELGRDLPFYIGHPDEESFFAKYRDHKAYGWITDIVANEANLELHVNWTPEGEELLTNRAFRWWSPRFFCRVTSSASNERELHPFLLKSCGLSQEPNMDELEPIVNEDEQEGEEITMNLLQRLVALFGKDDVNTEDEVVAFVQKLLDGAKATKKAIEERWKAEDAAYTATENEAPAETLAGLLSVLDGKHNSAIEAAANELPESGKTEIADLQEQLTTANEALASQRKDHAGLLIEGALEKGGITPAQKESWEGKFAEDFESAANELAAIDTSTMHTETSVKDAAKRDTAERSRQDQILSAVNEVMKDEKVDFDTAFARVKKSKKALFESD